jgi:hypothetical protein
MLLPERQPCVAVLHLLQQLSDAAWQPLSSRCQLLCRAGLERQHAQHARDLALQAQQRQAVAIPQAGQLLCCCRQRCATISERLRAAAAARVLTPLLSPGSSSRAGGRVARRSRVPPSPLACFQVVPAGSTLGKLHQARSSMVVLLLLVPLLLLSRVIAAANLCLLLLL